MRKAKKGLKGLAARMEGLEDRRLMTVSDVQIISPTTVDEGRSFQVEFVATTDGQITRWVIEPGDGTTINYDGPTVPPQLFTYPDGEESYTIRATTYDTKQLSSGEWVEHSKTTTKIVTTRNVAPTFTVSGDPQGYVGEMYYLSLLDYVDPGQDTREQWKVDWGDGTPTEFYDPNIGYVGHTYEEEGNFTVNVSAIDEDGEFAAPPITAEITYKLRILLEVPQSSDQDNGTFHGKVVTNDSNLTPQSGETVTIRIPKSKVDDQGWQLASGGTPAALNGAFYEVTTTTDAAGRFHFSLSNLQITGQSTVSLTFSNTKSQNKSESYTLLNGK
jgi:hypothetical protein